MAENLENTATPTASPTASPAGLVPTVVADNVDIVYRVNGAGGGKGSATAALSRIIKRKKGDAERGVRKVHAVRGVSFTAWTLRTPDARSVFSRRRMRLRAAVAEPRPAPVPLTR